jgi:hypothetical protein
MENNYVEKLKSLLTSVGFEGRQVKIPYEYIYQYTKTIVLEDMNHQSDLIMTMGIVVNKDTDTYENSKIDINIKLYNKEETLSMPIKNCIEYIKSQFKFELRKIKLDKLINEN